MHEVEQIKDFVFDHFKTFGAYPMEVEVEDQGVSKELEKKIARVIKKLEKKLKNIEQKLKAVSIVTAQIMIEQQPDLSSYTQQQFYQTTKKMGHAH